MTRDALTPAQVAARWLAREDLDQSPHREALAQWLEESQENRDAWLQAHRMWSVFDEADESDLIAAMARAARRAGPEPAAKPLWPRALAACLAVAAVSAALFAGVQQDWFDGPSKPARVAIAAPSPSASGQADYVTGATQKSVIDLPDGTHVTLDADSALDVVYAKGRRDVRLLKGHAFFDVAHDRAHPFAVRAGERVVTALGTQFDVQVTPDLVRVVLAEGSVSVAAASRRSAEPAIKLRPGEVFVGGGGAPGKVEPANLDQALAWKQGVVEFHDQPLSEAVGVLNRYTRARIVIRDPRVGALRITGVFKTGDIKRFGRSVSQVLPVRLIARDADTYELVSAGR